MKTAIKSSLALLLLAVASQSTFADRGVLQISTDPGDAEIYINGKRKGNSPASPGQALVVQLKEGEYTIEARQLRENEQYNDSELWRASKKVYVADDTIQSVTLNEFNFVLGEAQRQQRSRTLTVRSNVYGDEVFINGKSYGATPVKVELLVDSYDIEVRKPEHKHYSEKVQLKSDYTLKAVLQKADSQPSPMLREIEANMVKIPAGSFRMGDIQGGGLDDEKPVHNVIISAFLLGTTEVTFAQWDACVAAGGCWIKPNDRGWGRGSRPVMNVSWQDITEQFIPWLNRHTDGKYRLPTEAEWEYAARAGSETKYFFGNNSDDMCKYGNGADLEAKKQHSDWTVVNCNDGYYLTASVASFAANAFGLYDMHGNLWEWTQDCRNKNYEGAPIDGSAWLSGDCSQRVLRGGSWSVNPNYLRSANRNYNTTGLRNNYFGFRLARTLD